MGKYEEALERAKAGKPLDEVFPELKESEDERIRKEIVDFLLDGIWRNEIIDRVRQSQRYSKWVAYLERMKEQKSVNSEERFESIDNSFRRGREVGFHEGVESVKQSAEWSKEDEKMFERIKEILNIADAELCKKLNGEAILIGEAEFNYLKFGIAHCLSWLELRIKSLRSQPHWKPSVEQMEALKLAYEDAFECPESCVPHLPLKDLLNDLQKL